MMLRLTLGLICATLFPVICALATSAPPGPPRIAKQSASREVLFMVVEREFERDQPFLIECEAEGVPRPEYSWLKNGELFHWNNSESRIVLKPHTGTLIFTSSKNEDEGDYQCRAINKFGTASSDVIRVRRAFLDSFPNSAVGNVTALEGEPLKLQCNPPDGYPTPNLFWMIQNVNGMLRMLPNSSAIVDPVGNLCFARLTLDDSSDDDFYACAAHSSFRREYKLGGGVRLQVLPRSSNNSRVAPVEQYTSPGQVLVLGGHGLQLWCVFGGNPVPEVQWSKSGLPLNITDNGRITSEHAGSAVIVRNVSSEDAGHYACTSSNGVGTAETRDFNVTVEAAPFFTTVPESRTLVRRSVHGLECKAGGSPAPEVRWTFNGEPLAYSPLSGKLVVAHSNLIFFLNLSDLDTGVYGCNASNRHGHVYREAVLRVADPEPARIVGRPQDVVTVIGNDVKLRCSVSGVPEPELKWLRHGADVLHASNSRVKVSADGALTITNVQLADEGEYECQVQNSVAPDPESNCACTGSVDSARATLRVKDST